MNTEQTENKIITPNKENKKEYEHYIVSNPESKGKEIRPRERKMEITLSNLEYCKVGVKYQADTDVVKDKRNSVAKEMAKEYEVKGFRKGKATPEAIRLSYPKEVDSYLKQEMLNQAISDAVSEKNIKPFGGPSILSSSLEGNNFDVEFSIHILPEFELKEYKGFDIPKHNTGTTIEELSQQILQELRTEHSESVPYSENDFIQMTDSVVVEYKTVIGDSPVIKDLSSEGTVLEIGRINVAGFDNQLLGMKIGEEKTFTLKSPSKDFNPEYLDKDLTFTVKILSGSKKAPAALDDMLAQKIGLKDFAELEIQVKGVAGTKIQGMEQGHYFDQIGRRLIANHDFKIPSWIAEPEAKVQVQMQKKKWEDLSKEEQEKQIKDAEDGIKLSLVLSQIQENEPEAQLSQSELLDLAKKNISQYTQNPDKVMENIYSEGKMSMLLTRVKDEFSLNFILKNCNIIE